MTYSDLWAIKQDRVAEVAQVFAGNEPGDSELSEEARLGPLPKVSGAIAILGLGGVMTQKGSDFAGTSTEQFTRTFNAAVASSRIKGIVIDADSPGGEVFGTPELASAVFDARGSKPIVAVANPEAASAAFWVATAADKLFVSSSGHVGSVGVLSMHVDQSKALEQAGLDVSFITFGAHKVEGNSFEPLDEEARAHFQERVNTIGGEFVGAVAKNRNVSRSTVSSDFGQGRMLRGKEAVDAGMADGTGTLDDVLAKLGGKRSVSGAQLSGDLEMAEMLCEAYHDVLEAEEPAHVPSVDKRRRKLNLMGR